MKKRCFLNNTNGISTMYDAILFIVMVSLSGVILTPAFHNDIIVHTTIQKHREQTVDELLHTFLVSRVDEFSYKTGGDIIDNVASTIGINISSNGLYDSITAYLLGHEQLHKTYAHLLTEDLACQFQLPLSSGKSFTFNIFTLNFDRQLKNRTKEFFTTSLQEKYRFNFTAFWEPIKGVALGGKLSIGDPRPDTDCYVARRFISIPYPATITIKDTSFPLTPSLLQQTLLPNTSQVTNITKILKEYQEGFLLGNATTILKALEENITDLTNDFLINGIHNTTNKLLFSGIVDQILGYSLDKFETIIKGVTNQSMTELMGEAIESIDSLFAQLNNTNYTLSYAVENKIADVLSMITGKAIPSLGVGFNMLRNAVKENVTRIIKNYIKPCIRDLAQTVFQVTSETEIMEHISSWLCDCTLLDKATVVLVLWSPRE